MGKREWTCPYCPDFEERTKHIDSFLQLGRAHQMKYTNPHFRFCPWCGMKLEPLHADELPSGKRTTLKKEMHLCNDHCFWMDTPFWLLSCFLQIVREIGRQLIDRSLEPVYWHIHLECEAKENTDDAEI